MLLFLSLFIHFKGDQALISKHGDVVLEIDKTVTIVDDVSQPCNKVLTKGKPLHERSLGIQVSFYVQENMEVNEI